MRRQNQLQKWIKTKKHQQLLKEDKAKANVGGRRGCFSSSREYKPIRASLWEAVCHEQQSHGLELSLGSYAEQWITDNLHQCKQLSVSVPFCFVLASEIHLCFCDHVMFSFQKLTYLFVISIGCCKKVQLNENGLADTREHSLVSFLYKARPCRNLRCELQIQQQPNSNQSFKICYVSACVYVAIHFPLS